VAADRSLFDSLDDLHTLAADGEGWNPPAVSARSREQLARRDGRLADVLDLVPAGRLVILGKPGAGKSVLMIRLVLDLLGRRDKGEPVLISVASWDPAQDLDGWLTSKLSIGYPPLGRPDPADPSGQTFLASMFRRKLITPVLDGLDEIGDNLRQIAIAKINDQMQPGQLLAAHGLP
jgi:hypothetical protein